MCLIDHATIECQSNFSGFNMTVNAYSSIHRTSIVRAIEHLWNLFENLLHYLDWSNCNWSIDPSLEFVLNSSYTSWTDFYTSSTLTYPLQNITQIPCFDTWIYQHIKPNTLAIPIPIANTKTSVHCEETWIDCHNGMKKKKS